MAVAALARSLEQYGIRCGTMQAAVALDMCTSVNLATQAAGRVSHTDASRRLSADC